MALILPGINWACSYRKAQRPAKETGVKHHSHNIVQPEVLSSLIRIFDFIEDSAINNTSLGAERFSINAESEK
jgi:hypothetical protein